MRTKGTVTKGLLAALILTLIPITAFSAQKITPGSTCKVYKQKITHQNKVYTCIKSGKKLVWNKGVVVKGPTPTPTPTVTPSPTAGVVVPNDLKDFGSVVNCKLKDLSSPTRTISTGFPITSDLLGKSEVKVLGLYVDFTNMKGHIEPKIDSDPIISKFNEFYDAVSYGNLKINWTIPNHYYHLTQPVDFYRFSLKSMNEKQGDWANIFKFPQDVIDAADSEINFSQFDALVIFTPPQATDAEIGDVSPGDLKGEIGYKSQDGPVRNIRTYVGSWRSPSWADSRLGQEYLWRGIVHEFGHILGLPDYYMLDFVNRFDSYVGQYDIMGVPQFGQAPELFAWSRWLLGWLPDKQVICNQLKSSVIALSPIETKNGETKFVVIPISDHEAIGIESRRAVGFDSKIGKSSEGVLIYKIDTSKPTQKGPIQIQSIRPNPQGSWADSSNLFRDAPLKVGETLQIGSVKITLLRSTPDSDVLTISQ